MCRPHFGGPNLEEICFLKVLCFVYFRHEQMDLGPNPGRNKVVHKLPMLKSDFNLKWYQVFQKASCDQAILWPNTSCTEILGTALKATPADTAQICRWWCSWASELGLPGSGWHEPRAKPSWLQSGLKICHGEQSRGVHGPGLHRQICFY